MHAFFSRNFPFPHTHTNGLCLIFISISFRFHFGFLPSLFIRSSLRFRFKVKLGKRRNPKQNTHTITYRASEKLPNRPVRSNRSSHQQTRFHSSLTFSYHSKLTRLSNNPTNKLLFQLFTRSQPIRSVFRHFKRASSYLFYLFA